MSHSTWFVSGWKWVKLLWHQHPTYPTKQALKKVASGRRPASGGMVLHRPLARSGVSQSVTNMNTPTILWKIVDFSRKSPILGLWFWDTFMSPLFAAITANQAKNLKLREIKNQSKAILPQGHSHHISSFHFPGVLCLTAAMRRNVLASTQTSSDVRNPKMHFQGVKCAYPQGCTFSFAFLHHAKIVEHQNRFKPNNGKHWTYWSESSTLQKKYVAHSHEYWTNICHSTALLEQTFEVLPFLPAIPLVHKMRCCRPNGRMCCQAGKIGDLLVPKVYPNSHQWHLTNVWRLGD